MAEVPAEATWAAVHQALAEAASVARPVRIWLRDDDAVEPTPALDRLAALCGRAGLPILLAAIPAGATPDLGRWLADHPHATACQHGFAHHNHAAPGERACEIGGARSDEAVLAEVAAGWARLRDVLGGRAPPLAALVPPWNRIRDSLVPRLASVGMVALSAYGVPPGTDAPLPRLDVDLDIIDWRRGRTGRPVGQLCSRLLPLIARAGRTGQPVGLLTHHLAHDEAAWRFVEEATAELASHPHVRFTSAAAELGLG